MRSPALLLALCATAASAASLSGTVTGGGAPVAGAGVRLWIFDGKSFSFTATGGQTTTTDGAGAYAFAGVPAGQFIIDVRGGTFADRYYVSDGGSGYADGTVLTLAAGDNLTGLDMVMDVSGGLDGMGTILGGLSAGVQVRTELVADPRVNHNDATQGAEHQGAFYNRGLPPGLYRVALHDQNAVYADKLGASNFTVTQGANGTAGTIDLAAAPADPYEPNNSQATGTAVDPAPLRVVPQTPYVTTGARIAPRNSGDVDWYCTTMRTGDRLVANAVGRLALETGGWHESPWVDPVMSLWRPDTGGTWQKVMEGDDNGPLVLDALVDTGELAAGGPMCVAVSTYGDTTYTGMSQGSAGDYQLTMKMGNRGPTVSVSGPDGGFPTPPSAVTINDGDTFTATLTYSDPENDPLSATWELVGASNAVVTQGSFNTATGTSTFQWTAGFTADRDSPYTLTLQVSDGDITRTVVVIIHVLFVNVPPTVPVQLSPIDGGHVQTWTPDLVCTESSDLNQETTTYEYELYYGGDGGTPAQATSVVGVDGGWVDDGGVPPQVLLTATTIPENSRVKWRVRAFDGHPTNGYSAWTGYATFLVDVMNDPPLAAVITKPVNGDTVLTQKATITVAPPVDPEDDPMQLFIDIAKDPMFMMPFDTSGALTATASPTMWTMNNNLDWGGTYYARAHAVDSRGGVGPFSATVSFSLRANQPPSVPPFTDPDSQVCNMGYILSKPSSFTLGQSVDPEMDTISIQLQLFLASEDPDTATPVFDQTRLQQGTNTTFDVSSTPIPENLQHRARVRASDMYGPSAWGECVFTVGMPPMGNGGGAGTGGGAGGDSGDSGTGGGGVATKGGCNCGSAEGLMAMAALALLRRRRGAFKPD